MGKLEIIIIICTISIWVAIALSTLFIRKEMLDELQFTRDMYRDIFQTHQEWLFNQLYSMAPGKVLMPDEIESVTESKPATIIHTSRDPMNEFTGKLDDWRD